MCARRLLLARWFGYQVVWLACALGAGRGASWPGILASLTFIAASLCFEPRRREALAVIAASGISGAVFETALLQGSLVNYGASWPSASLAPAWIIALWLAFGAVIPSMAAILGSRPARNAAAIAIVTAPLAYWAGARLGALEMLQPAWTGYVAIALGWAVLLPGLTALSRALLPHSAVRSVTM